MFYKIEIHDKPGIFDAVGAGIKKDILDLGITCVKSVSFRQVYVLSGDITDVEVQKICRELLVDTVSQNYTVNSNGRIVAADEHVVEVAYNPGVMDPVEESVLKGIRDIGIEEAAAVKTARKYILKGKLSPSQLKTISEKLLFNKLIQHVVDASCEAASYSGAGIKPYEFKLTTVPIVDASDDELLAISKKGQLFLNVREMRQIQGYFAKQKRDPTDCELETVAQTWSEHCYHKTFRGKIDYSEKLGSGKRSKKKIDNLLKSTIMKATKELAKPWCVSVFKDNAGVIRFDDKHNVCFKVETHNHPSALEPFGGANTGIGGVIRDPMGTGLGAKPILNTDVFCFGRPDYLFSKLPQGTLHPKRIAKGVVSGVRDYGNKMGIPTVNGAVLFHNGFVGNPLVYCGTVGIMPRDKCFKVVNQGDLVVVVGGRTGRDGIHGATFSSGELTHESETISSGAVQIGNPIQEKKMCDTILQARDLGLYNAITDCGAGGLSSAVGEMGQELGADVWLDKVPLKYSGLSYMEIWISESQERMVLAVSKEKIDALIDVFKKENVEATVIGEFSGTRRLKLFYKDNLVCDLDMHFLHEGIPVTEKKAEYIQHKHKEPVIKKRTDLTEDLCKLLSHYDICSKEWVVRQYDHEVQGGSILKPLVGVANDGPSDAAVVRPVLDSDKGLIVSCGINFRFGFIDPYWMAASCIDEALRQIIACGGSLKEVAILDNFCWGNPDKPDRLGGLVRTAFGCYETATAMGVPFISGKDSLYNEYSVDNKSVAIPGTILISAISVMDDINKTVSMYAKEAGNLIYIVGATRNELGGSHYFDLYNAIGNAVPRHFPKEALAVFGALSSATSKGLVRSAHDCSDGGLAVAAAEMAFAGGLGMELFLNEVPVKDSRSLSDAALLFSESNSRFIVEVSKKNQAAFEKLFKGIPCGLIGCVTDKNYFTVFSTTGGICVKEKIEVLKKQWREPLAW